MTRINSNVSSLVAQNTLGRSNAALEQALTRLAHCVLTANVGLPHRSTREAIALAIHLVVHIARRHGRREVTEMARLRRYDPQQEQFELEAWAAGA